MKKIFKFGCLPIIGIIIIIIIIAVATSSGDGTDTATTTTAKATANTDIGSTTKTNDEKPAKKENSAKKDKAKTVGIGEPAKIANVSFTVDKVETKKEIKSGNDFIDPAKASGKFVILDVTVKNDKKDSITINSSFFKIKTADGTTYGPTTDGSVMMAMGDDMGDFFLKQINPGLKKQGKIVFDVPKNLDLSKAVLHCQTGFWGTETVDIKLSK